MPFKAKIAAAFVLLATPVLAANPMVGGAPMYETKNIVENAVNSADHTTLVAAVKAAGLVDALQSPGDVGQCILEEVGLELDGLFVDRLASVSLVGDERFVDLVAHQ